MKHTRIDERKYRLAKEQQSSKPRNRYKIEVDSKDNWRAWKAYQAEADMHKSFAEDADALLERYKQADDYLEMRDDGYFAPTGDDRVKPHSRAWNARCWFGRKP